MACDAATLEALTIVNKDSGLSDYDTLVCRAYVYGNAAGYANAAAAIAVTITNKLASISDRDLDAALLSVLCH